MPYRNPAPHGCLDPRLGVSDKKSICQTCKSKLTECAGHFGHIQLELPVFHIGYFRHTLTVLQVICKSCARILLPPTLANSYRSKIRRDIDTLSRKLIHKKIVEKSKKIDTCPYCCAHNGAVKKVSGSHTLKLVHEIYKGRNTDFIKVCCSLFCIKPRFALLHLTHCNVTHDLSCTLFHLMIELGFFRPDVIPIYNQPL